MNAKYTLTPVPDFIRFPCNDKVRQRSVMNWLLENMDGRTAFVAELPKIVGGDADGGCLEALDVWFEETVLHFHREDHFRKGILNLRHGQAIVDYYEFSQDQETVIFDMALCLIRHTLAKDAGFKFGFFEKAKRSVNFGYPLVGGSSKLGVNFFAGAEGICRKIVEGNEKRRKPLWRYMDACVNQLNGIFPKFEVS